MKTILVTLMLLMTACTSKTDLGPCVGMFDKQDAKLEYKLSAWNLSLAFLFSSLILPPVFVIVDETFCPVGKVQ